MNNKILKFFLTFVFFAFHGSWMRNTGVLGVGWVEGGVESIKQQSNSMRNQSQDNNNSNNNNNGNNDDNYNILLLLLSLSLSSLSSSLLLLIFLSLFQGPR